MKWLLAGLAFALLVGLAVFTVALRTKNLAARARIAVHNDQIMSLRVEQARRDCQQRGAVSTDELIRRLREFAGSAGHE